MIRLSVDDYQVGWICAIPTEYAAAKAMLEEQHQMVSGQDRADSNSYTLGRIHDHNIAIACLPAGVDGTNAAAIVATNLSRTFRSIRFGLMVGIGGGIPDLPKGIDIRLGDIVVSQPIGRDGGVIQYDRGKSHDNWQFERKGQLNKPPVVLLTALASLRAEHELDDSRVPEYLDQMLKERPKMRTLGYSFPVCEPDILRCLHNAIPEASCGYCENGEIIRPPRASTEPVIHYGIIASGNQVVKSAMHRDQLRDECGGAICVEMEAAGLMDSFPCLVIRGICDYADSSKNDKWHRYAAATAAAFAKELLLHVSVEQTGRERPIQEILNFITETREHIQQQQAHNRWQEAYTREQELEKVPIVAQAMYGALGEVHEECHPSTRLDLLSQIRQWASQPSGKPILWLNGKAGTGKSTISWTFAAWLANQGPSQQVSLGASFFFKRGEGDRGSARRFFPTIVRQLVTQVPGLDNFVVNVIRSDPLIFGKAIAEQFRQLVLQPLQGIHVSGAHPVTLVVVVDALDECENENDIQTLLALWPQLSQATALCLKLFLTSRPELAVRLGFQRMSSDVVRDIDLVDAVPLNTIRHDLSVYLHDSLRSIGQHYHDRLPGKITSGGDWPGSEVLKQLVDLAEPLFIVAATVCRFVGDFDFSPFERLEEVMAGRSLGQMSQLEATYVPVLSHLVKNSRGVEETVRLCNEFRLIVGSIILLADSLSMSSLADLLDVSTETIHRRLAPLHSVLRVPADYCTPLRTLHLSFAEFLLSEKAQEQPFGVDGPSTHLALSSHCLRILSCLRENICDLDYPGQSRYALEPAVIASRLSPAVQYSCQHWVHHIKHSRRQVEDAGEVHSFLKQHFLHWLEALSLIGRIPEVICLIDDLRSCASQKASRLISFLDDARRFVLAHRYIIDLAPLQLYSCAIIFSPRNAPVRTICGHVPSWIQQHPGVNMEWGPELQKLEGHTGSITDIVFAGDGSLLASGCTDATVRLWDIQTGREVQRFDDHIDIVNTVSFSADSSLLVSGSCDGTVRVRGVRTGREVQALERPPGDIGYYITSVSFSPHGSLLASPVGYDIRLWDLQTGREVQKLNGDKTQVRSLSFSPDGVLLASGSQRGTIKLWHPQTGQELQKFEAHSTGVMAISFPPDGSYVAAGYDDNMIRLWDMHTGQQIQKLKGHSEPVHAISVSSLEPFVLASGSEDWTIRLWDTRTGQETQKLEGHSRFVSTVAYHPHDSFLLASGSWDRTVRLWDVRMGRETQRLGGHSGLVTTMSFSPPHGSVLASGSIDGTVRLWATQTGRLVRTLEGRLTKVNTTSFSLDGNLLASGSMDSIIRLWDTQTGQEVQKLTGHTGLIKSISFSPQHKSVLASSSIDDTVKLWDVRTGKEMQNLEGNPQPVGDLKFSPDGRLLLSHYPAIGTVKVWDVPTGRIMRWLEDCFQSSEVSFADSTTLMVNGRRRYDLGRATTPTTEDDYSILTEEEMEEEEKKKKLRVHSHWITRNDENLLWLPYEYRGSATIYGDDMVAIGGSSGRVSIFRFDFS